jgi:signal transduction histidine kinase/ActR/RegA family two-component response regulator
VNWLNLLDRHGSVRDFETRLRRLDGREIWVRETARTVRGPTGAIESYEGTVEDITERRNLEDQFRQAQKMEAIGQLAGGVAHDFNNLLTAILGHAEFLRLDLPADGPHQEDVEEIRNAVGRATALTRQLLAFSRRQVLEPLRLDLNTVITDLNRMLRRVLPENIELITALLPGVRPVLADPVQLERVLLNLVVNSRDAMPEGGKLTLETANVDLSERYLESHQVVEPGRYSVLIVSDTGEGMTPEVQRRVFEPFYTTKEQGKGTGLGLASVYGIVKQSSGYIWVYSEPSKGTTFKLYLPSVEKGSTGDAAPAAVRTGEVDGTETILLVEDDDVVRKLTRDVLERHGYSVLVASNGTRALEQVEGHKGAVDLLITDVIMPEMGGPDLARRLAGIHPSSRVLFMSGYAPGAIVHHGVLESGAPFLPKPFTPDDLALKVREVLDSRPRTAS